MSAILGVARFDTHRLDPTIIKDMSEILIHRGPDKQGVWCQDNVGLGQNMLWTTPESLKEQQPLHNHDSSLVLVSDARIDNRKEMIAALSLTYRQISDITDAELILAAYQKWGEACPSRLIGDFAFVVWNQQRKHFFCARDPMGVKSLYYHFDGNKFVFGSEIKALFKAPWVPHELNEARVADHLVNLFDDQQSTFFRDIFRLPAAHYMTVNCDGTYLMQYWKLDPNLELNLGSDGEYEEAFRELMIESVQCRLRSAYPVGSTLSGGLDSSSITCIARDHLKNNKKQRLHTFSAVFPSMPKRYLRGIDERSFMQAVIARGGIDAHQIFADQLNPIGSLDEILWHQDDPFVPFNLYIHLGIYRAAQDQGVRVILDGFDGDTTLSYGYDYLAELTKSFNWITLLREARALSERPRNRHVSLKRILWKYAISPLLKTGLPVVWRPGRQAWNKESIISESFARSMNLDDRIRQLESKRTHRFRSARDSHCQSLESPLIRYALELVDKSAALCSIEPRYPFFDRRFVEFCLSLPPEQKLRNGWVRSIMRRSMQDILPPEIQWRDSKGNLSANFYRNLLIFGKERIDEIIEEDLDNVADYINVDMVKTIFYRYSKDPVNPDTMALFVALTFAAWMRKTF